MNVVPMFRCRIGGIDSERFDAIDRLQYAFDLWPAADRQQHRSAGLHEWCGDTALACSNGAQNIDT